MSRSKNELLLIASALLLSVASIAAVCLTHFSPKRSGDVIFYTQEYVQGKVDINTAVEDDLTALYGIGSKRAEKIIEYREEHGDFICPWEITNVNGIGEGIYGRIKDDICV